MFTAQWFKDAAERVLATAAEAALGVFVVSGTINLDTAQKAGVVGAVAGASLLKSLIAGLLGNKNNASLTNTGDAVPKS